MFARQLAAVAALSLAAASPAAAQSAASLSLSRLPAAAELGDAADLRGGFTPYVLGAVAIGILIFVIIELGKGNELPGSP